MFNAKLVYLKRLLLLLIIAGSGMVLQVAAQTPGATVMATAQGEFPGVSLELQGVKRTGEGVVTVTFAIENDSDKPLEFAYHFVEQGKNVQDFGSVGGTYFIDSAGKKKYLVLRDADDIPLSSRGLNAIAPQSRANLWVKFPAPPADVQKISIVVPHFNSIDDVPIGQ